MICTLQFILSFFFFYLSLMFRFEIYDVLTSVNVQNVRIGYSMLSDAEEIGAISPGKVHHEYFLCIDQMQSLLFHISLNLL